MNWKYQHFETVISTNDTARDYPPFTIITANSQTNGRGRYGRAWESAPGNLYFSAVLPIDEKTTNFMPFVAAVAVVDALAPIRTQLKWPNDVLLDGQKIAGILLERSDNGLIVGIGINLSHAPKTETLYPATHLNNRVSAETLTHRLAETLLKNYTLLCQNGFKDLRNKWLSHAIGLNTTIHARLATQTVTGIFTDLSLTGALILQQPNHGTTEIVAGDIFFEKETL